MAAKYNKNDNPIGKKDLAKELDYKKFAYQKYFIHLCNLIPVRQAEKLEIATLGNDKQIKNRGVVYIFVISGKIFKIGSSTTSLKDRVNSYNCGKSRYRMHGTNSTTNYFVLQSCLKIGQKIKVYAYFPAKKAYRIFGEKGQEAFPPAKLVEKKILVGFKKTYGRLPIACSQK